MSSSLLSLANVTLFDSQLRQIWKSQRGHLLGVIFVRSNVRKYSSEFVVTDLGSVVVAGALDHEPEREIRHGHAHPGHGGPEVIQVDAAIPVYVHLKERSPDRPLPEKYTDYVI